MNELTLSGEDLGGSQLILLVDAQINPVGCARSMERLLPCVSWSNLLEAANLLVSFLFLTGIHSKLADSLSSSKPFRLQQTVSTSQSLNFSQQFQSYNGPAE